MSQISDNKRIAKNTLLLYFRMLFMMLVYLYISRVLLQTLGVEDFGIYNVVGGFVAMFAMVSGAMTIATQRFLSFAIGNGSGKFKDVFSTAFLIHLCLGVLLIILGETVGIWFVKTQMNLPSERYTAALWVFQFSLFTFFVNLISVPYNAAIVANEKMSAFAYISIVEAVFKLLIVYLLMISKFDKLILYAVLMAVTSVLIRIVYGMYCSKNIRDCKVSWHIDSALLKQMFSFVSWNMIGSLAGVMKDQGINVVLNVFFGAAINAARGIAMQVNTALNQFVVNFQMAMNPQIVKLYAAEEKEKMFELVFKGSRVSFLLLLILSLPIMIETPFVLSLWLVNVPDYSVIFLRIIIAISLIDSLSNSLITSMHASGKVRDYQIVVGGISLLTLPFAYCLLKFGLEPYFALFAALIISVFCHIARLLLLSKSIGFPALLFLKKVSLRVLMLTLIAYVVPFALYSSLEDNLYSSIFLIVISFLSGVITSYFVGLDKNERKMVLGGIKKKLCL